MRASSEQPREQERPDPGVDAAYRFVASAGAGSTWSRLGWYG
jgi:hypothetical protein